MIENVLNVNPCICGARAILKNESNHIFLICNNCGNKSSAIDSNFELPKMVNEWNKMNDRSK